MGLCVGSLLKGRKVVTEAASATVRRATQVMSGAGVGALPVVDGRHLIGIFTERDVLRRVVAVGLDADRTRLQQVMTRRPETVSLDCSLDEALDVMLTGQFRHLPVISDGELVGMISLRDFPVVDTDDRGRILMEAPASA